MHTNAVAGPSTLYLPPPRPPSQTVHIKSTNDLISQFHLKDAYDKYVKPSNDPTSSFAADKGKGKEVAQEQDDDEPAGKGEKMKKNGYRHLIKNIPGKHSTKKDDYLTSTMQAAPKQRVRTASFDTKTQADAFEVSLEGLKGWNSNTLIVESAQAKEDRRKRKELKRIQRAQIQGQAMQLSTPTQTTFTQDTSTPKPFTSTAASASTPVPLPRTSTPQPSRSQFSSTPQPSPHVQSATSTSSHAMPPSTLPRSSTPSTVTASGRSVIQNPNPHNHVPTPVQIPTQKAATPRTATPTITAPHPLSAPPLSAKGFSSGTVTPGVGQQVPRGKKRELEDSTPVPQHLQTMNGHANGNSQGPVKLTGIKAGNNGVRPRPVKKQRMDSNGLARDSTSMPPVQQPTPQGV